jgi:hypothetical protein
MILIHSKRFSLIFLFIILVYFDFYEHNLRAILGNENKYKGENKNVKRFKEKRKIRVTKS